MILRPSGLYMGVLGGTPLAGIPSTNLDVVTSPDTTASIDVDVTANDSIPGNIENEAIASGPGGGTVSVVNNQIRFAHNGTGVYVITYDSRIGALTDPGQLVVSIVASAGPSGSPPAYGNSWQASESSDNPGHSLIIPSGNPLPANTRGLLIGITLWLILRLVSLIRSLVFRLRIIQPTIWGAAILLVTLFILAMMAARPTMSGLLLMFLPF